MTSSRGLVLGSACFFGPKEFQAVWKRTGDSVEIRISDYLIDAPDSVLNDFSKTVVQTISGERPAYGSEYLDWVRSDEYVCSKRKIYLKRSRNLTGSPEGNERNLLDSLDRLLDSELLDPSSIGNSFFSWTKTPNVRKMGVCSPMMRTVGISSALDDVSVPEYVLDYVVYHEALHLAQGYRPGERAHCRNFRENERKYPEYEKADRYLRSVRTSRK
jgi:hypothetical protein